MTEIEVITRKWGNSLGIAIPKEMVEREHLHENQKVIIEITKATDLQKLKGLIHFRKTAQKIKDEMRGGW